MGINQTDAVEGVQSAAEQALQQVGEAVLARIRQELPHCEVPDDPIRVRSQVDDSTQPTSVDLWFEKTADMYLAYQRLASDEQYEVFNALRAASRYVLHRAEPTNQVTERDVAVYVFSDRSAVEMTLDHHRIDDPTLLPTLRAISWKQPLLLVGDNRRPAEMNLFRLGYQEAARSTDTTIYRHYDPAMPLVGYGYSAEQYHLTVFNAGQPPAVVSVPQTGEGRGKLINLHEPALTISCALKPQNPVITFTEDAQTRYPVSLLDQVASQFDLQLAGDNAKRLLNGQKTDVVVTGDGSTGKLYVLNTPDAGPQLVLQHVQGELTLKDSYLGHVFTDKDKQNLIRYGDMGRAVDLIDRQSSQRFTGFVGVDKDTKTLTVLRADQIRPKIERMSHLKGIPLNGLQKQRLMEGQAVRLDKMTSKAGTLFSAYVRVSAAGRNLRFDPIPAGQPKKATTAQSGPKVMSSVTDADNPVKPGRTIKTKP